MSLIRSSSESDEFKPELQFFPVVQALCRTISAGKSKISFGSSFVPHPRGTHPLGYLCSNKRIDTSRSSLTAPPRIRTSDSRARMTHLGDCLPPFEHSDAIRHATLRWFATSHSFAGEQSLRHTIRFHSESLDLSRATTLLPSPARSARHSPSRHIPSLPGLLFLASNTLASLERMPRPNMPRL